MAGRKPVLPPVSAKRCTHTPPRRYAIRSPSPPVGGSICARLDVRISPKLAPLYPKEPAMRLRYLLLHAALVPATASAAPIYLQCQVSSPKDAQKIWVVL